MCHIYDIRPNVFYTFYGIFVQFIQFILPLIILVYCYGRIIWVLHSKVEFKSSESKSNQGNKFELARKNTIKTFVLVGLCLIICWSQNQIYFFMFNVGFDADWDSPYYDATVIMVFLNCTVNPFIYLIKYDDYKKALRNFVKCQKKELSAHSLSSLTTVTEVQ